MSVFPGPWNPIAYAQFYVGGGWRTTAAVVGGYALLVGGGIWFTATHDLNPERTLEDWAHGLVILQALALLGFGTFRVNAAVRQDVSGRMIESHRLMPTSPLSAVVGYVLGAPVLAILVGLVTLVAGSACVAGSGGRVLSDPWLQANGMIAAAALCAWCVVGQFAFAARGGFVILAVACAVALASQGEVVLAIPALKVISAPLLTRSVVELRQRAGDADAFAVTLAVQAVLATLCGLAAIRRYRSPTVAGFSPALGLMLVAVWVVASLADLRSPALFTSFRYWRQPTPTTTFTTSIAGAMLLALVPISSGARGTSGTGPFVRRAGPLLATVAIAALVAASVSMSSPRELPSIAYSYARSPAIVVAPPTGRGGTMVPSVSATAIAGAFTTGRADVHVTPVPLAPWVTGLSTVLWLAGSGGLFACLAVRRRRAWAPVVLWIGATWVGPVLADQSYQSITRATDTGATWLSTLSPIGAVGLVYDAALNPSIDRVGFGRGLAGQAVIALVPITVAAVLMRRRPDAAATT